MTAAETGGEGRGGRLSVASRGPWPVARGRAVAELPAEPADPTHLQVAVPGNSGRPPPNLSHVSSGNPSTAPPSTRPWESATQREKEGWIKASAYRSCPQGVTMGIRHALFVTN